MVYLIRGALSNNMLGIGVFLYGSKDAFQIEIIPTCLFHSGRREDRPIFRNATLVKSIPALALVNTLVVSICAGAEETALDTRVGQFLESRRDQWQSWNIPWSDGRVLHDLIVENNFQRALEIGTSTGHSSIWIAWALSKTGGRLVTIEIDEGRHRQALANFKEAGVAPYIDARLGDAHELVYQLEGPFDFVFSDADKRWYKRYMEVLLPKLDVGGCFTAHNVRHLGFDGMQAFLDYAYAQPNLATTIDESSGAGLSISCKKR